MQIVIPHLKEGILHSGIRFNYSTKIKSQEKS